MKKSFREILISAIALMVIAAVVTAALAATNMLTQDKIAAMLAEKENTARTEVIADAEFEQATLVVDGKTIEYHIAKRDGETVGYVFTVVSKGKGSGLKVMTGVDVFGQVLGVKITDDNETAGYIDKLKAADDKRDGKRFFDEMVGKVWEDVETVDKVTNATKTSLGVRDAVKTALKYYDLVKGGDAA